MIGAPTFMARSMTLQIFSAYASDSDPPKTVKSWLKTKTVPAVDETVTGDDAVAEERLGRRRVAVGDEGVELDERAGIEQQIEALARGQLPGVVLLRDARRAAALARRRAHPLEERESLRVRRHRSALLIGLSLRKDSAIISAATMPPPTRLGYPQIR